MSGIRNAAAAVLALGALACGSPAAAAYYDFQVTLTGGAVCSGVDGACTTLDPASLGSFRQRWTFGKVAPRLFYEFPGGILLTGDGPARFSGGVDPELLAIPGFTDAQVQANASAFFFSGWTYGDPLASSYQAVLSTGVTVSESFISSRVFEMGLSQSQTGLPPNLGVLNNNAARDFLDDMASRDFSFGLHAGRYTLNDTFDGYLDYEDVSFSGVARLVAYDSSLAAVPEPGTWALIILGFGLAGAALRRPRGHPAGLTARS
jgi:hypothetical protein